MKAIIFDIDNTLIYWKKEFIFALENVLKDMNYNLSKETIKKIDEAITKSEKDKINLNYDEFLSYINNYVGIKLTKEFLDKLIVAQGECIYEDNKLIEVIEYLSTKYDLYAISNWYTKTQTLRLEKMRIAEYFKMIIGADENYLKPDKRAFNVILEKYDPKDCISVGDNLNNDVILPISLGMDAYWKTKEKSNKYKTFYELEELMNIL